MIKALGQGIIFRFEDSITGGKFDQVTTAGIVVVNDLKDTLERPRWGVVTSVGRDVREEDVKVGQRILVESLKWTESVQHEGSKYWRTNLENVLAVEDA